MAIKFSVKSKMFIKIRNNAIEFKLESTYKNNVLSVKKISFKTLFIFYILFVKRFTFYLNKIKKVFRTKYMQELVYYSFNPSKNFQLKHIQLLQSLMNSVQSTTQLCNIIYALIMTGTLPHSQLTRCSEIYIYL